MTARKVTLALAIFTGFILRAYFFVSFANGDLENFTASAALFARRANIYAEQFYFNYSPAIGFPLALLHQIPFPFAYGWGLLLSSISLGNGMLLAQRNGPFNERRFLLYWLNPALILLDGYGVQFEALALFPLLLAVKDPRRTWLWATLALIIKHVTLPLVWGMFVHRYGWKRGALLMLGSLALFAATFIPYLPAGAERIVTRVLLYRAWPYGLGSALLFWALVPLAPLAGRWLRLDLTKALRFDALVMFVLLYGGGADIFAVLLIVAFLKPDRWLWALSAGIVLLVNPWLSVFQGVGSTNVLWALALGWLGATVWSWRRQRMTLPQSNQPLAAA